MTRAERIAALTPIAGKLAAVIARLGSPFEGEQTASIAALGRLLGAVGLDFADLACVLTAAVPASHDYVGDLADADDEALVDAARSARFLTAWEKKFLASLAQQIEHGRVLSEKQRAHLCDIVCQRCVA